MNSDTGMTVRQNPRRQRYELQFGGELAAFADYRPGPGHLEFVHTEVLPQHEGRGLASRSCARRWMTRGGRA